jgi:hypothetical protein
MLGVLLEHVFCVGTDILEDEERLLEEATFLIEGLSLFRLLVLKKQDWIGAREEENRKEIYTSWLDPLRTAVQGWIAKDVGDEDVVLR